MKKEQLQVSLDYFEKKQIEMINDLSQEADCFTRLEIRDRNSEARISSRTIKCDK
jgi:hypothetical protein